MFYELIFFAKLCPATFFHCKKCEWTFFHTKKVFFNAIYNGKKVGKTKISFNRA